VARSFSVSSVPGLVRGTDAVGRKFLGGSPSTWAASLSTQSAHTMRSGDLAQRFT